VRPVGEPAEDVVAAVRATVARRDSLPPETVALIGERDPLSYGDLQRAFAAYLLGERDWETTEVPKAAAKAGAWIQDRIPRGRIQEQFGPWNRYVI
jgi:hypothetical protein